MNSGSTSISYTLTVSSKYFPIVLNEGRSLQRRLKNEEHRYLIEHPCNPSEQVFLRISAKQSATTPDPLKLSLKTPAAEMPTNE